MLTRDLPQGHPLPKVRVRRGKTILLIRSIRSPFCPLLLAIPASQLDSEDALLATQTVDFSVAGRGPSAHLNIARITARAAHDKGKPGRMDKGKVLDV